MSKYWISKELWLSKEQTYICRDYPGQCICWAKGKTREKLDISRQLCAFAYILTVFTKGLYLKGRLWAKSCPGFTHSS